MAEAQVPNPDVAGADPSCPKSPVDVSPEEGLEILKLSTLAWAKLPKTQKTKTNYNQLFPGASPTASMRSGSAGSQNSSLLSNLDNLGRLDGSGLSDVSYFSDLVLDSSGGSDNGIMDMSLRSRRQPSPGSCGRSQTPGRSQTNVCGAGGQRSKTPGRNISVVPSIINRPAPLTLNRPRTPVGNNIVRPQTPPAVGTPCRTSPLKTCANPQAPNTLERRQQFIQEQMAKNVEPNRGRDRLPSAGRKDMTDEEFYGTAMDKEVVREAFNFLDEPEFFNNYAGAGADRIERLRFPINPRYDQYLNESLQDEYLPQNRYKDPRISLPKDMSQRIAGMKTEEILKIRQALKFSSPIKLKTFLMKPEKILKKGGAGAGAPVSRNLKPIPFPPLNDPVSNEIVDSAEEVMEEMINENNKELPDRITQITTERASGVFNAESLQAIETAVDQVIPNLVRRHFSRVARDFVHNFFENSISKRVLEDVIPKMTFSKLPCSKPCRCWANSLPEFKADQSMRSLDYSSIGPGGPGGPLSPIPYGSPNVTFDSFAVPAPYGPHFVSTPKKSKSKNMFGQGRVNPVPNSNATF